MYTKYYLCISYKNKFESNKVASVKKRGDFFKNVLIFPFKTGKKIFEHNINLQIVQT